MLFAYFLFRCKSPPLSFSPVTVQRKQTARYDVLTAALLNIEVGGAVSLGALFWTFGKIVVVRGHSPIDRASYHRGNES